ncbi:MAG: TIGR02556 family CRISPR-associated protein [Dictyoglomaceae bacterium]|nr:TIGR02556 family CRISPR-associated protein [Dictyoglomaceae bacterium]HPU44085.1 TIGR02556 family CRISPR-associated protein [Dictyoglomaceae bacterium]
MLKEFKEIGKVYKESIGKEFAYSLVLRSEDESEEENEKEKYLLIFNFDLDNNNVSISFKEIEDKVLEEFLWVGNCKGNISQDRLTTNVLSYLLFQALEVLYSELPQGELKNLLDKVLKNFFLRVESNHKKISFLNFQKIKDFEEENIDVNEILSEFFENKENMDKETIKKFKNKYENKFYELLKKYKSLSQKDVSLYSVTFNGKKPSDFEDYVNYIERKIIDENFEDGFEGYCFVCGKKDIITYDTARIPAKFYITKLITFSSDFEGKKKSKGYSKNFSLCKECYKDVISGIAYINNYLKASLAGNDLWIIPGFFFNNLNQTITDKWIQISKNYVLSTFSFENYLRFEKEIEKNIEDYKYFEDLKDYSFVDLLFYEKPPGRETFKIKKFLNEIPFRRIDNIKNAIVETNKIGRKNLGEAERNPWFISLDGIYYLIPARKGRISEYKKILDIYESIYLGQKIDKEFLISSFIELFKIYQFEKGGYNVRPGHNPQRELVISILKTNLLLKFFETLKIFKGGDSCMQDLRELLDTETLNYINDMGYSEQETALFFLGYLIGEIGAKQIEGAQDFNAKKPILNKINFNGMSAKNLIELANEVFEKLDQYRIRGYNEKIYTLMKKLLDLHIKNWNLSDKQNVYYILSGYAFNTYKKITYKKGEKQE